MRHRHNGTYTSRTSKGNTTFKHKPIHKHLNKYKDLNYKQLRKRFNISKYGDDDRDDILNYKDCRPWDKRRHGFFGPTEEDEMSEEEQIAKQIIEEEGREATKMDPEEIEAITKEAMEDFDADMDKSKQSRWRGFLG